MRLIRHIPARFDDRRRLAVAVGNFDGLHRGHQALVQGVVAHAPDLAPALMCFEPLPATLFRPDRPVPRIMKLRDRIAAAEALGLEILVQLKFDRDFASLTPAQFARDVLARGVGAGRVVVGEDFRFGHRAAGDVEALRDFGRRYGFEVAAVAAVCDESGQRISSTRLRAALEAGSLEQAERLLGRRYCISGRVVRGQQLGRTLGFATANLRVAEPPALSGICAVEVSGAGLVRHPGVASLGRRPTVAGRDWLLEVHLFDFEGDLYGRHLAVDFVEHLRSEEHFDSVETMTRQMHIDARRARRVLNQRQ